MNFEGLFPKKKASGVEKDHTNVVDMRGNEARIHDPVTGVDIGHVEDIHDAKRKLRRHFEEQREAA